MNGHGQSDGPVVPANPPNKAAAAEVGEERGSAKGNTAPVAVAVLIAEILAAVNTAHSRLRATKVVFAALPFQVPRVVP